MTIALDVVAWQLAGELHRARKDRREVATITSREQDFGIEDAYRVQSAGLALRLEEGEKVIGGKLGFTSRAMRDAMGVDHPNYGWLTDAMVIDDGDVHLEILIHPKVEPEIAFLLASDLTPPVSADQVLAATDAVMACLEVVDSRFVDFRFTAPDNIADNSSAGLVAFGAPHAADGVSVDLLGVVVSENQELRFTAAGAAALEHPAAAVAWMANNAVRTLRAGDVIISGGLTPPIDLQPGTVVTAEFDRIGSITIHAI